MVSKLNFMRNRATAKFKKYEKILEEGCFIVRENYCVSQLVSEIFGNTGKLNDEEKIPLTDILPVWKALFKEKEIKSDLSLYVHIPYCLERCYYCYTHGRKLKEEKDLDIYTEKLIKQCHFFTETFKNVIFNNLYIGGGTPNILREDLIKKLLKEILSCFKFTNKGEMTFENDPRNSSLEKLRIIKKYGINRVSFGIQTFNITVLNANNRTHQSNNQVEKSIADARSLGFDCINVDLIVGLYGESRESILNSIKEATRLNPDTISIYTLQPMSGYLKKTYKISREDFFQKKKELIEDFLIEILKKGEENNYFLPNAKYFDKNNFKHLNDATCFKIVKKDFFYNYNIDTHYVANPIEKLNTILGLGEGSSSTLTGRLRYKMESPLTEDPNDYKINGIKYNIRIEMIKNIIDTLSNQKNINLTEFKERFNKDLLKEFANPINELEEMSALKVQDNNIYFNCEDPRERFIYLLFFFEEKDIDNHINKKKNKSEMESIKIKEINFDKNLSIKIKKIKEKINNLNTKRIEGFLKKIDKDKLIVQSDNSIEKELFFNEKTIFSELFLKSKDFNLIGKREISVDDFRENNSVVVCVHQNKDYLNCLIVEKITVLD